MTRLQMILYLVVYTVRLRGQHEFQKTQTFESAASDRQGL